LEQAPEKRLPKEIIEEELAVRLTTENVEQLFQTLVGWGRFAELFGYSTDTHMLYLDVEGPAATL
jgi:NitT/TauT family transport system ATP-binding protein